MRCLRRTATALLLGLALGAAPASAGDVNAAIRVANAVYPSVPQRCGAVTIEYGALSEPNQGTGAIAEAFEDECRVRILPEIASGYSDARVCSLLTHEWGHLAGRRFPENAADPGHSANPADNMYGGHLVHHPACGESDEAAAGRRAGEARARTAAEAAASRRETRLEEIRHRLGELKDQLDTLKAARRRAKGAKQSRYSRRIRRVRVQIRRLRAEYRSLVSSPLL